MNSSEIIEAFDEIDRSLQGRMMAMKVSESMTIENLCDTYQHIRPWIETIMPVLDRISTRLSSVLRLLMQIADTTCPARPTQ